MKYDNIIDVILIVLLLGAAITIGWVGNEIYDYYRGSKIFAGLWIPQNLTHDEAIKTAISYEKGNWVCVNTNGMDTKQIIEICTHETMHELFARECSKNANKCMEAIGK